MKNWGYPGSHPGNALVCCQKTPPTCLFDRVQCPLERWPSGRRRATRNRVTLKRGSRVRIPLSPPYTIVPRDFGTWQATSHHSQLRRVGTWPPDPFSKRQLLAFQRKRPCTLLRLNPPQSELLINVFLLFTDNHPTSLLRSFAGLRFLDIEESVLA